MVESMAELKFPKEKYPKITVMITSLNRVHTIEKAVKSVLDQNYPNLEICVMDAASTDGTVAVLDKYKEHYAYYRSRKDNGTASALNEAIDNSEGDVLCLVNSDDYLEPNTLVQVGEAFIENPDIDMVNVLGRTVKLLKDGSIKVEHECNVEMMDLSGRQVRTLHPNCRFYKRHLFDKYGKFIEERDGKMTLYSDFEFITRLSLYDIKNVTLPTFGYTYLAHEDSLTFNTNKYTKLKQYDENAFYVETLFAEHGDIMDERTKEYLGKKYRKSFCRRVVKNIVDKDTNLARKNAELGVRKWGIAFLLQVIRYWASYHLQLNRLVRKST